MTPAIDAGRGWEPSVSVTKARAIGAGRARLLVPVERLQGLVGGGAGPISRGADTSNVCCHLLCRLADVARDSGGCSAFADVPKEHARRGVSPDIEILFRATRQL